ncbi:hypothetical protein KR009_008527 [Drosophila setifemur]|nr:hypothetical protein KR009_008527 [Drosophila setifemur]
MSVKQNMALQLAEPQLAKLTSESEEIRMRALEQVETRFIRCLRLGEQIQFKPVLLLKQLIRWFGHTPPLAPDRVLAMMVELLRSEYADVVVRKIPFPRLKAEMEKVRRILRSLESPRITDLLDDLEFLLLDKYKIELVTPTASELSTVDLTSEGGETMSESVISQMEANLTPEDYEPAWTQPSVNDVATMKSLVDFSLYGPDSGTTELKLQLTHLTIRMGDYPAEFLLQSPFIFLHLVHLQKRSIETLFHVNRAIIVFLKQLQRRIQVRRNTLSYSVSKDAPRPVGKQLKVESAMGVLMNSCTKMLHPLLFRSTLNNWHLLELVVESIRTYDVLNARVSPLATVRFGAMVTKLLSFCNSVDGSDMSKLVDSLMIPRLQSLIFNGLLQDTVALNLTYDKNLNRAHAISLIQPLGLDSSYLSCMPERMKSLSKLMTALAVKPSGTEQELIWLKRSYGLALNQLMPKTQLGAVQLLKSQRQICMVVNQVGSETLVKQLFDAVVECTPRYASNSQLRKEAESLLHALLDLPDEKLREFFYRLMPRPVVAHFHAFMNKTVYMTGCSNLVLARNHILGLPLNSNLLRKLLLQTWSPNASKEVVQWCIDYPTMLLKLSCVLGDQDFRQVFHVVLPVVPLMIYRSITHKQLHKVVWDLYDPDGTSLDPPLLLRGFVCYLFHPDEQTRRDAIAKIAYTLQWQDDKNKYRPTKDNLPFELFSHDLCLIQPPVVYGTIFTEFTLEPFQGQRSLDALIRLLQTSDLRPSIRKSTLTQLNVLLQNWKACEDFSTRDDGYSLLVEVLHSGLKPDVAFDPSDILLPAMSILMKLLFHNPRFRRQVAGCFEVYVCLLRALFLVPHEPQLRKETSICLFQMIYHDCITTTEDTLVLDVDLSAMNVPFTYELNSTPKPTAVSEGMHLQQHLQDTHFGADANRSAQHWRLYTAHRICNSPARISLEGVQSLDIRDSLKIKVADVALVQASQLDLQLRSQLTASSNCSSHEDLEKMVAVLQLFLVLMRSAVPSAEGTSLWKLIHKYIRSAPVNNADSQLYSSLLELCLTCLRFSVLPVITGLNKALESDPHHSFLLLLHDREITLDLLHMISQCLMHLLAGPYSGIQMNWHGKLFMQLSAVARTHFDKRQLQHVRCILRILRRLSERNLAFCDAKILHYCQHFIEFSSDLRTSTQTGAQWQRDCLYIICQLHTRLEHIPNKASEDENVSHMMLRYLLGLCGHSDVEVKALSWVLMSNWITIREAQMIHILPRLKFLPGGLPACCLTTLLDIHEAMIVRELAGRVFILLMPVVGAEDCIDLLHKHDFLKDALKALKTLHVTPWMGNELVGEQHSCEIVSCYVGICSRLVVLRPEWCAKLCQHGFMNCLSDVFKTSTPPASHTTAFLELCAGQICELYALCYRDNFDYLQRTICRDNVFLQCFLSITNDVLDLDFPENLLVELFKLFLVFCKDPNAHDFLCEHLKKQPAVFLDFFLYGLHLPFRDTPLQRYTLSSLAMVFIKAQHVEEKESLLKELELYVLPLNELMPIDEENIMVEGSELEGNVLNRQLISLSMQHRHQKPDCDAQSPKGADGLKYTNAVVLIYHRLDRLFEHFFPAKLFNFLQSPSTGHVQICETLGGLLKLSPWAVHAAKQLKLLDRVLDILDTFLSDVNIGNACTYVKRVGAHKSRDILSNLIVLLNMLAQWHSSHHAVITQPAVAVTVVKLLIRMWPWLSHSAHLKKLTVQLSMFLTEHSFEMCKQASVVHSGQSHSLLQLMVRVADHETTRKETPNSGPSECVVPALRVMVNCCSCAEGRLSLTKMHVLDMFDTILPANPVSLLAAKVRPMVLTAWLGFWEVYSRYDVGAKACHLHSLICGIRYSTPLDCKRILCLRILRNMSFFNGNRTKLVDMAEFVNLLRDIVNQPVQDLDGCGDSMTHVNSFEEHRLAVLMVWKLFCFGAKYKGMLRGTKLLKLITSLRMQLTQLNSEQPERYSEIPFAADVADLLKNIHESLQQ